MKITKTLFLITIILSVQGCASSKNINVLKEKKITDPKIIAINGTNQSWRFEIEKRLRNNGFQIKRFASQNDAIERVSENKLELYKESSARYILNVEGYAPDNKLERCYGGGYNFNYINVELIDVRMNETIFHYSNSGYSEGCQPFSGTIFTDIEDLIKKSWN